MKLWPMLKVVLIGHPASQKIVPASKYLTGRYLDVIRNSYPHTHKLFDIIYLNHRGAPENWAHYVATFLEYFEDEHVILALDDYLLADFIDMDAYTKAVVDVTGDAVCAKLCECTAEEHIGYPVSTQYTIWNREFLIKLLKAVRTPWEFELRGSEIFKQHGMVALYRPCLKYFTNSCLSSRWEGIRLDGLKDEDINYLKENNYV